MNDAACAEKAASRFLTPRQAQIANLIGHGMTNKEIAKELNVSPETIKDHIRIAMRANNYATRSMLAVKGEAMSDDAAWAAKARDLATQLMVWAREPNSPQGFAAQEEIARIKTEMCADLRAEQAAAAASPDEETSP